MSEIALLTGVRNHLRTALSLADNQCQVEIDEYAPATSGNKYLIVHGATSSPGPYCETNAKALDEIWSVNVTVALRAVRLPKDRSRNFVLDNVGGLGVLCQNVTKAICNSYTCLSVINGLITGGEPTFIKPLTNPSNGPISTVGSEFFGDANGEERGGVIRTITFSGARIIRPL